MSTRREFFGKIMGAMAAPAVATAVSPEVVTSGIAEAAEATGMSPLLGGAVFGAAYSSTPKPASIMTIWKFVQRMDRLLRQSDAQVHALLVNASVLLPSRGTDVEISPRAATIIRTERLALRETWLRREPLPLRRLLRTCFFDPDNASYPLDWHRHFGAVKARYRSICRKDTSEYDINFKALNSVLVRAEVIASGQLPRTILPRLKIDTLRQIMRRLSSPGNFQAVLRTTLQEWLAKHHSGTEDSGEGCTGLPARLLGLRASRLTKLDLPDIGLQLPPSQAKQLRNLFASPESWNFEKFIRMFSANASAFLQKDRASTDCLAVPSSARTSSFAEHGEPEASRLLVKCWIKLGQPSGHPSPSLAKYVQSLAAASEELLQNGLPSARLLGGKMLANPTR